MISDYRPIQAEPNQQTGSSTQLVHRAGWSLLDARPAAAFSTDPLQLHDSWLGPFKALRSGGAPEWVCRFAVPGMACGVPDDDAGFDSDLTDDRDRLLHDLAGLAARGPRPSAADGWCGPDHEQLAAWLHASHCQAVADSSGGFRFTVSRRGHAGQVTVMCHSSQLRFRLPLAEVLSVPRECLRIVRALAEEANDRVHFARIVWHQAAGGFSCQAQVDLTGLPWSTPATPRERLFWREVVHRSICSLQLCWQLLGHELLVLSDRNNRHLTGRMDRF